MRSCFFSGDEIIYNDTGTNELTVGGWIRPHLTREWKKVVLHVSIKNENSDDPHICVECLSSVYTRLGKNEDDSVFRAGGERE